MVSLAKKKWSTWRWLIDRAETYSWKKQCKNILIKDIKQVVFDYILNICFMTCLRHLSVALISNLASSFVPELATDEWDVSQNWIVTSVLQHRRKLCAFVQLWLISAQDCWNVLHVRQTNSEMQFLRNESRILNGVLLLIPRNMFVLIILSRIHQNSHCKSSHARLQSKLKPI
jgi:hypothetical protein